RRIPHNFARSRESGPCLTWETHVTVATDRTDSPALAGVHSDRLFIASCMALISTAVAFAIIGDIMGALKEQFILTNLQVGLIGGAALWGFTISIFILGPLCDALGMRTLMWVAFISHVVGVIMMMTAVFFP